MKSLDLIERGTLSFILVVAPSGRAHRSKRTLLAYDRLYNTAQAEDNFQRASSANMLALPTSFFF